MKKLLVVFCSLFFTHAVYAQSTIHFYAASSMTNAVQELVSNYQQQHPDRHVVPVFGSSSALARQIEHGAPADVFLSANEKWVRYLVDNGRVSAKHVNLLVSNELVLIEPSDAKPRHFDVTNAQAWRERLDGQRMAVGNTQAVPAGIYARETLQSLGVWNTIKARLAQTNNVRLALALVERAEAPYGIVYKTDALQTDLVKITHTFASARHDPIYYPLVQVTDSTPVAAFTAYLRSEPAKHVLEKYGFNTDLGSSSFTETP